MHTDRREYKIHPTHHHDVFGYDSIDLFPILPRSEEFDEYNFPSRSGIIVLRSQADYTSRCDRKKRKECCYCVFHCDILMFVSLLCKWGIPGFAGITRREGRYLSVHIRDLRSSINVIVTEERKCVIFCWKREEKERKRSAVYLSSSVTIGRACSGICLSHEKILQPFIMLLYYMTHY